MLNIPYGKGHIEFEEKGAAVLSSAIGELKSEGSGSDIVAAAMAAPIDSPKLSELAKGKNTCTVIISDHTRPVPSRDILPNMLAELYEGNPEIKVTLLVATGFHRPTTSAELCDKLGEEIMAKCPIVIHDCRSEKDNVCIGTLPSGAPLVIDRVAAETELLIAEGFIEPHFFAGFSGGRKSVLPGVCDQVTVLGNHCSKFIDSQFSRTGILDGNPIHADMIAAAEMAKLAYIVNVVIDEDKKTVAAFAGDYLSAHRKGCDFLLGYCKVAPAYADIVITSNGGAPLDQNVYQSVKGLTAAEAAANEGATLIICAECADGIGGDDFYQALREANSATELLAKIKKTPMDETVPDQWQYQILARMMEKYRIIFVTNPSLKEKIAEMKMEYAADVNEALAMAKERYAAPEIVVIPDGVSIIVGKR